MRRGAGFFLLIMAAVLAGCGRGPTPTPTPTPSSTPQPTATASPSPTPAPTATFTPVPPSPTPRTFQPPSVRFAIIGDYGQAGYTESRVARLVHSWEPDFILTVGDNNYPEGSAKTIEANIFQYYGADIYAHRFFPALGNHDWGYGDISPYLAYLHPLGNGRYYDFAWGPVHIFVLDSCPPEPDGITAQSKQARWLRERLATADEPWKIVALHRPPYSSGPHGNTPDLQWPFAQWGATAVVAGHDHDYERILRDGIVYFVNGLGGHPSRYPFEGTPVPGSAIRYRDAHGAMLVTADAQHITFQFIATGGTVVDTYTLSYTEQP
ncbi:MAG: alkaline phosphatase [Chloroflexi bacterium]|nr:alkaline phosphatase [Chloroflexota bacterium]